MTADPMLVLLVQPNAGPGAIRHLGRHFEATGCPARIETVGSVDQAITLPCWDAADAVILDGVPRAAGLDLLWRSVAGRPWAIPVYLVADVTVHQEANLVEAGMQAILPPTRVDRLPIQIQRDVTATRAERRLDDAIGDRFFHGLVTGLAKSLDVRFALVGQVEGPNRGRIGSVAVSVDGVLGESISYSLNGTPCNEVISGRSQFVGERAADRYPECTVFQQLGVQSYFGLPLFGSQRETLGLLALMNDRPLERTGRMERVASLFAARAGAELERRSAEAQRASLQAQLVAAQKMEAIGTLAGGIAHDFNNVLMGILGNAEMGQEELQPWHPAYSNLSEIARAAHRGRDVVQRILTFSRKRDQQRRALRLEAVVDELAILLRATLPTTIEVVISHRADGFPVLADSDQVHQVLMNLITNAAQAIGKQTGTITVTTEPVTIDPAQAAALVGVAPGEFQRISVSDTGPGMEREVVDRIFEPFFTTKPPGEGTGLGLAVVHGIMRAHDGAVVASSQPGAGSQFDLYFPGLDLPIPSHPLDQQIPRGNGQHILLIDDEAAIVRVGQRMLERLGYRVLAFTRPRDGLERWERSPDAFHAVICDYTMPELTGIDLASRIKARNPLVPILLTTGHPDLAEAHSTGLVDGVLPKPFATAALAQAVHRLIGHAQAVVEPPTR